MRCQLCRVYRSVPLIDQTSNLTNDQNNTPAKGLWSAVSHRLNKGLLCPRCHDNISWLPDSFKVDMAAGLPLTIQAASFYDYPIRQAIRGFKQSEDMTKLPLLVHALRQLPRPSGCHARNSIIIPMPTTDQRLMKRGFDPVTILSAYLSQHWQIPLWHGVQRTDNTVSQQGLSRAERLTNLDDAFILTETIPVKRLLIFDDVATTGASLQALARALYMQSLAGNMGDSQMRATANDNLYGSTDNNPNLPNINNNSHNNNRLYNIDTYNIDAYALAHGSQRYK